MLDATIVRHKRDFVTALANGNVLETPEGVLFTGPGVLVSGEYFYSTNGGEEHTTHNLIPTEGLNYLLNAGLRGGTQQPSFYLAIFSGNYTPVAGLTAATFAATASEITSNTEGYSELTRPVWTPAAPASGVMDNLASRASFNIVTTGTVTIRGAALLSDSGKGSTAGTLISAGRFAQDRVHYSGDVFTLGYRVRLQA